MRLLVVLWQGVEWRAVRVGTQRGIMPRLRAFLADSRIHDLPEPGNDGPPPWRAIGQEGYRVHQVGWSAALTRDANGVAVSEEFAYDLRRASIHPPGLVDELTPLALAWSDMDEASLRAIVPLAKDGPVDEVRRRAVASFAAATASIHAAATWAMEHRPWDVVAVRYAGISKLRRELAGPGFSEARANATAASTAPPWEAGVYGFYDLLLTRLLELAGPEAAVLLVLEPPLTPFEPGAGGDPAGRTTTLIASERFVDALGPEGAKVLQRDWPSTVLALVRLNGRTHSPMLPKQESVNSLSIMAERHFRAGRYQACRAVLEQMQQAGVDAPPLQFALAVLDFLDGRRGKVATRLDRAKTVGPCTARLMELIGRLYLRIRRPAEGLQALQAAVDREPTLATAFEAQAIAYLLLRDPAAAEREARTAVQLDPQRFEAHYRLGLVLRRQGRLAEARDAFRAAISVDPRASGPAHRRLAEVFDQLAQPAFAAHHRALAERQPRPARPAAFDIEWFAQGLAS